MLHDLLGPDAVRARGLFDASEVARLIRANESGHEDNALRLWALLTLELWYRTFVDGDSTAARSREATAGHALSVPATE
jgi:asparagine synthase (glutamine-hydrolysing)